MEDFHNDTEKFKQFLATFTKDKKENVKQDEPLPFRLFSFPITEDEIEAEVADWVTQYLTTENAPNMLISLVVREVVRTVMKWDIKSYYPSPPEGGDQEDQNDMGDKGSDSTEILEVDPATMKIDVFQLARDVFKEFLSICEEWSEKIPDHVTSSMPKPAWFKGISWYAVRNTRRRMEDRHLMIPYFNTHCDLQGYNEEQSFFTVFDGHGGTEAAIYSTAHLHHHIAKHPSFKDDPVKAIIEAFLMTDQKYVKKAKAERLRSGCTCVCALFRESKLHVAWLGDSQLMLVKDGEPRQLMDPHKPERKDEKKRIEALGGFVMWFGQWRVNATLSVSRSIGDADFKPYVSADADDKSLDLEGDEDYLILACDGLWDTMSYDDVAEEVYDYLHERQGEKSKVAEILAEKAIDKGSGDNVSVIVVFLREHMAKPRKMPVPEKRLGDMDKDDDEDDKDDKDEEGGNSDDKDSNQPPSGDADNNQGSSGKNQGTGGDNPGTGGDNPGTGGDNPGTGGDNPGTGSDAIGTNLNESEVTVPYDIPTNKTQENQIPLLRETSSKGGPNVDVAGGKEEGALTYSTSVIREPFTPGIHSLNVCNTPRRPTPYNVYKVLLSQRHRKAQQTQTGSNNTRVQHPNSSQSVDLSNRLEDNGDENGSTPVSIGNASTKSIKYLSLSDRKSHTSSAEVSLTKRGQVMSARKVTRKGKNGKRRNIHRDMRRLSRDRLSLGIAERTKSSNSSSSSPRSAKVLPSRYTAVKSKTTVNQENRRSSVKAIGGDSGAANRAHMCLRVGGSARASSRAAFVWDKEHLNKVTSGYSYADISPTSCSVAKESKWTVATEIENASAMFGE